MAVKQLGKRASGANDAATFADLSVIGTNSLATSVTAYTLALTDAGLVVEATAAQAVAVTVPVSTTTAFPIGTVIEILQYGAGQVTIVAASGVTLRNPSSLTTRAQYSSVALRYRGSDEWIVSGDLT